MNSTVGPALTEFERAVKQLRRHLSAVPGLVETVFSGSDEWLDLLMHKLVPHLAGEGCLVVVVAGGTNTGKSTVFNLLNGQNLSPIVNTAAATCHPVLAASAARAAQIMEGKLFPEFSPVRLADPDAPVDRSLAGDTLLIAENARLPDAIVVMDTPDVDSIDTVNWDVAEHIRAAGDVVVAVLTGEKYKDRRVVEFFREAAASGRVIVPLMNKANPADDFGVAREQVREFLSDIGSEGHAFVVPHDFDLAKSLNAEIGSLNGGPDLWAYLNGLDIHATKEHVFKSTVDRFTSQAEGFVHRARTAQHGIESTIAAFEQGAESFSERYDPSPGEAVGGLFHEFVQSKRGPVRRAIGSTSAVVVRGAGAVGRRLSSVFTTRASLDPKEAPDPSELIQRHRRQIERIVRDLVAHYIEQARQLGEPLGPPIEEAARNLDVPELEQTIGKTAFKSENVSEEFRAHAMRTLDAWWNDHRGRRAALESLDAILAVMPAAIAVPISIHTGGVGAGEAAAVAGAMTATFVAKVMELEFGDAMFDFLSPWRSEQREMLRNALVEHITVQITQPARAMLTPFTDGTVAAMETSLEQCREA